MPYFMKLHEVHLSETENQSKIQIFKQGTFDHALYGTMKFDDEIFSSFIKNFDERARGIDIQANFGHTSYDEAAGWLQSIEQEGEKLYAIIEWTDEAAAAIRAKKWKYISPEFDLAYKDAETATLYGPTIIGVALTNIPFLKGMDAVSSKLSELSDEQIKRFMELETKEKDNTMNLQELLEALKSLNEADKATLAAALAPNAPQNDEAVKALSEENATLKAEIEQNKREMAFGELLANKKVVPAQKAPYMAGDMAKFAELSMTVNLDEAGSEANDTDDEVSGDDEGEEEDAEKVTAKDADEAQDKVNEVAEKLVADKGVSYAEAVTQTLRTHPKLAKVYAEA